MLKTLRSNRYYRPFLWVAAGLCLLLATMRGPAAVMGPDWLTTDDFVQYWGTGRLNLHGGDPYDPEQLLRLQSQVGWTAPEGHMMWNPPWMLALVMPFGALSYPLSRMLWLLLNLVVVIFSADLLWRLYSGSSRLRWASWLLGFTWIPVLDSLQAGQSGILILLGITGFLFFMGKKQLWLAGACLALLAIKPHVAYLLLLAALLWSLQRRVWALIGGLALAIGAASLLAWVVNPQVFSQYFHAIAIGAISPGDWVTPTLGGILRLLFGPEHFWLQVLPSVIGVIWLVFYWTRRRESWSWLEQAPLVILVSIVTMAYGWAFDQPTSLVAIVQIFVLLTLSPWSVVSTLIALAYGLINLLYLAMPGNMFYLFWLAPTVLCWYLISRSVIKKTCQFHEFTGEADISTSP